MIKYYFFFLLLIRTLYCPAQSQNICDGPYLSYNNGYAIIRTIDRDGEPMMDSFPENQRAGHEIKICFSNHAGWDFSVPLRKKIENEKTEFSAPDKIIALSDIEGEFEATRNLLIKGGLMDSAYHWTFGKGNLVICGDLFDRGKDVAAELWLLYKLEDEAGAKGGYVHTILGNHDIMNLSGDYRYVQQKYFDNAKAMGVEYAALYNTGTELGRWLRSKNIIEKIGDNLYLHGGISPIILARKMDLKTINNICRPWYDKNKYSESSGDRDFKTFFGSNALFWYRGYFMDPRAGQSFIDSTLAFYHAKKIIVGHTITNSNIAGYYNGKIIGIDVNEHEGHSEMILIRKEEIEVMDKEGRTRPIAAGPENPVIE